MAKILLALADHQLVDIVGFDLKGAGYEVLKAEDSTTAEQMLEGEEIDIVITEQEFKNADGVEFLDIVKSQDPRKPPTLIIAPTTVRSMDDLYDRGAEIVFQKPYNRRALVDSLSRAIDHSNNEYQTPPRVEAEFEVKLVNHGDEQQKTFNIARGGMFIQCPPPMPPVGSRLDFQVQLADDHIVRGSGIVRWQRRYAENDFPRGVGIEFEGLSAEDRETLSQLVNEKRIQSFIPKA